MYKKGLIVLTPFIFTDLSSQKVRPALVLAKSRGDVVVAFITSQPKKAGGLNAVNIKRSDKSFSQTGLKETSSILVDTLATLDKKIVLGELGTLPLKFQKEVDKKLKVFLSL